MIDSQLIESAKNIRRNFLKLNRELDGYQKDVRELIEFLQSKIRYLEKDAKGKVKTIKDNDGIAQITKEIIGEIEEIELEEKKLHKKISKINEEMEKLSKDEEILYQTIKERYPQLTEKQIIEEIHKMLEN